MRCPYCESEDIIVVDKRSTNMNKAIRRRRECKDCGKRFTTYERIESLDLYIIKKDKRRESFDRKKLERGIMKACEKRPVSCKKVKEIVHDIEIQLKKKDSSEIPSREVGKMVMQRLKKLDKVAYIRYASVYKEFKDVESFQNEISNINV